MKSSSLFLSRLLSVLSWSGRLCVVGVLAGLFFVQSCGNPKTTSDGSVTTDGSANSERTQLLPDNSSPQENNPPQERKPPPEIRCVAILTCAQTKCSYPPTTVCLDQCAKDVVGAGKALWSTLKTCLRSKCEATCTTGDLACLENCWKAECGQELIACSVDGRAGANSCRETVLCAVNCDKKDLKCRSGCLANGSPTAQQAYQGFTACQGKAAQKPLTPQEKQVCFQKEVDCQCPQNKPGIGTGACGAYLKCVGPCSNKACCLAKCRSDVKAAGLTAGDTLLACIAAQCKPCAGDKKCTDQCAASKCTNSLFGCLCPTVGAPGTGSQGCSKGLSCAQRCGTTNTCCGAKCLASMNSSGYTKFTKLAQCLANKCARCKGDTNCLEKCGRNNCSREGLSCQLD